MTKYGDISSNTAGYSSKRMLRRGQAVMVTERFGQFDPHGLNKTLTRKFRRLVSLPLAVAPLAEGITPKACNFVIEEVHVNIEYYGAWTKFTHIVKDHYDCPFLQDLSDASGEQMGETVEFIRLETLKCGTNVHYAGGVTSRSAVNNKIDLNAIKKIVRMFKRARARTISRVISPSVKVATEPVAAAYFCIAHTDMQADIEAITGFTPVEKYAQAGKTLPGEIGKVHSVRFCLTDLCKPWEEAGAEGTTYLSGGSPVDDAAACDVYPMLFIGKDAYGIVPLKGKNAVSPYLENPSKSKTDPMGQWGFISWITGQACVILNHSWLIRYESACTAL